MPKHRPARAPLPTAASRPPPGRPARLLPTASHHQPTTTTTTTTTTMRASATGNQIFSPSSNFLCRNSAHTAQRAQRSPPPTREGEREAQHTRLAIAGMQRRVQVLWLSGPTRTRRPPASPPARPPPSTHPPRPAPPRPTLPPPSLPSFRPPACHRLRSSTWLVGQSVSWALVEQGKAKQDKADRQTKGWQAGRPVVVACLRKTVQPSFLPFDSGFNIGFFVGKQAYQCNDQNTSRASHEDRSSTVLRRLLQ